MTRLTTLTATIATCGMLMVSATAHAAFFTWSGGDAVNNFWSDGDNWVEPGAPGWQTSALFPTVLPAKTTIDMNGLGRTGINDLYFEAAGYTIVDLPGTGYIRYDDNDDDGSDDIRSIGAGINQISATFSVGSSGSERIVHVDPSNHLHFAGTFNGTAMTVKGGGTMVVDSPTDDTNRSFNAKYTIGDANSTLLFNSIEATNNAWDNGTVGGSGGIITYGNGGTTNFDTVNFLVGSDGVIGDEIGEFRFLAYNVAVDGRWNVKFNAGTVVKMQVDPLGNNDKVVLELAAAGENGYELTIGSGVTLDLSGSTIPDGSYVLFENVGNTADIIGTFDTVLYNGQALDPGHFDIDYNGNNIVLNVTGMDIPEPASMALMAMGGLAMLKRRR